MLMSPLMKTFKMIAINMGIDYKHDTLIILFQQRLRKLLDLLTFFTNRTNSRPFFIRNMLLRFNFTESHMHAVQYGKG